MQDFLEKNLNLLEKKGLNSLTESLVQTHSNASVQPSNTVHPLVTKIPDCPSFKYTSPEKSFTVHSVFNPMQEAKNLVRQQGIESGDNVYLFGFGFGYCAEEIIKIVDTSGKLAIFEPNIEILYWAFKLRDFSTLLTCNNVFIHWEEENFLLQLINKIVDEWAKTLRINNSMKLFFHNASIDTIPPNYPLLKQILEDIYVHIFSHRRCAPRIRENILLNKKLFASDSDVQELYNKFNELPAFVVSAGPSLDKNILELKKIGKKGVIIATDAALIPLLKVDIKPNIVLTVDSHEIIYNFFRNVEVPDVILVYSLSSPPKIREEFKGQYFKFWVEKEKNNKNVAEPLTAGGSVSITATDLAVRLGCNPIVLAGLDLSFPTNLSHCKDCIVARKVVPYSGTVSVSSKNGKQITTPKNFSIYLRRIENYISQSSRKFYNATEGITKIAGANEISLREAVKNFCNIS